MHELASRRWVAMPDVDERVKEILAKVQEEGDEALTTYTRQFDCKFIDSLGLRVSDRERQAAREHPEVHRFRPAATSHLPQSAAGHRVFRVGHTAEQPVQVGPSR